MAGGPSHLETRFLNQPALGAKQTHGYLQVAFIAATLSDDFIQRHGGSVIKKIQHAKLDRMWELASGYSCRTNMILNYFDEFRKEGCGHCDNCLNPAEHFDGTILAQKALSAIARCKESANFSQLIDILKGAYKDDIRMKGFHLIKTFGAGRDISFPEWRTYITQLINIGLIKIDYVQNSVLQLTPLSRAVLVGKTGVQLFKYSKSTTTKVKKPKSLFVEDELFQIIKNWRSGQAKKQRIPPYTILHDRTLKELSSIQPTEIDELVSIDGIGKVKKAKYGAALIEMIKNYKLNQN